MDYLTIEGTIYAGRYDFDIEGSEFTTREWGWIKSISGYLPLTIEDGFAGADPELIVSFAVIALHRAGRIRAADASRVAEIFFDAPATTTLRLETDEVEGEDDAEDPPPSSSSSTENGASSGNGLRTSSASLDDTPVATGTPDSDTSASLPVTRSAR